MHPRHVWKLAIASLILAVCNSATSIFAAESADASKADGTWKWTFTMSDGGKIEPSVRLKREGDALTGTTRFRSAPPVAIQDGKIDGERVSWIVVRESGGRKVTTRYEGKIKGDTIKGSISSDWAGETRTYPWEAKRSSATPNGEWKWDLAFGQTSLTYSAQLKLDGRKLTGKLKSRDREYDISEGKWQSGEVSFVVKRERDGTEIISTYHGKLDGDIIKGTVETAFGSGEPRPAEWLATRAAE